MAVRRALACVLLLAAGCGGDAFSAGDGGSSGNGGTSSEAGRDAGGSGTTGGTSRGGSSNAGSNSGGSSSAGTATAGTSSAGSNSGGTESGGMSMGGTDSGGSSATGGMSMGGTGGNSLTCSTAMDCTSCAYPTAPTSEGDCYCVTCADTPMNATSCENNQQHWEKFCANQMMPCPAVKCLPSVPPSCQKGRCVDAL